MPASQPVRHAVLQLTSTPAVHRQELEVIDTTLDTCRSVALKIEQTQRATSTQPTQTAPEVFLDNELCQGLGRDAVACELTIAVCNGSTGPACCSNTVVLCRSVVQLQADMTAAIVRWQHQGVEPCVQRCTCGRL